jgi:hypothetical protein
LNEQSLKAANDFLRIASASIQPGDLLDRAPTDIGKEAGLPNPLAVARAVRALAARRRLETVDGGRYRLLDARPLEPGEPESVPRTPRRRKTRRKAARTEPPAGDRRPSYADLGRAMVDRIIELGREAGDAVGHAESLRRESKDNKASRIEAEQRARKLFERVKELENKLEMAEGNLRTVLAAARGRGATAAPSDNEMEALLKILKTPKTESGPSEGGTAPVSSVEEAAGSETPAAPDSPAASETGGPTETASETEAGAPPETGTNAPFTTAATDDAGTGPREATKVE